MIVNVVAILIIPVAFWHIDKKSKRSKLFKDPSDYWEKFHADTREYFNINMFLFEHDIK